MKSLYVIFFCFLVTFLYLSSHISSSTPTFTPLGRQPIRKLSMLSTNDKHENQNIKVTDGESETMTFEEVPVAKKYYANSNSDLYELIHIDYHGVTTHPTPRHSTP